MGFEAGLRRRAGPRAALAGTPAAQLAMYLGWVRAGSIGAALVGMAFVLPSLIMVIGIALLYIHFGGLPWMQGVFYGVGASVIAIIARSTLKLAKLTLMRDYLLWVLFAISAAVTAITESELVWLFIALGVVAMLIKAPPRLLRGKVLGAVPAFLVTGIHGTTPVSTLGKLAWFFTKAGAFVFGSGLAIVPFLYKGVVHEYQWLNDQQFRDAVAVAMVTPGPVVITAGFIGYLTAALAGALIAAAGTFVPPFLVVVLAARVVRRASQNPTLKAFISGLTASATGAIARGVHSGQACDRRSADDAHRAWDVWNAPEGEADARADRDLGIRRDWSAAQDESMMCVIGRAGSASGASRATDGARCTQDLSAPHEARSFGSEIDAG